MPGALDIRVERRVRRDPEDLFEFLCDLRNHWLGADRFIAGVELDGAGPVGPARGGRVRMHGPLGLRRTAVTRVIEVEPGTRIAGIAAIGTRTLARITWTLTPVNGGTRVVLAASLERASLLDRMLLAAGAAPWMRRHLERTLARLDAVVPAGAAVPDPS